MATSKSKASKKAVSKKATKKAAAKKGSKKAAAKKETKTRLDLTKSIKATPGLDEHFYKKFPRYAAYQLLCSSPNRTLKLGTFLEKVEALDGVKNRNQALGIIQKLVDKKRHCGAVVASIQ